MTSGERFTMQNAATKKKKKTHMLAQFGSCRGVTRGNKASSRILLNFIFDAARVVNSAQDGSKSESDRKCSSRRASILWNTQ